MKKFITILTAAVMLFSGTSAFAQKMSFGIGYENSTAMSKISKDADPVKASTNGFFAGFGYTLPVTGEVNFTPGLYYEYLSDGEVSTGKTIEQYISVPLDFSFGADVASGVRCFVYAGPSLRMGLSSVTKLDVLGATTTLDAYDGDLYGRFDVMVGGGVAVELMDMIRVNAGYDYGLLNRYTGNAEGVSQHNSRITVGVSYLF